MEEADAGDGSGTPSHEILVVVLHRDYPTAGSVGITLAGGADYDTKDITVNILLLFKQQYFFLLHLSQLQDRE